MPTFSLLNIQGYEHSRSPTLDHMLKHSLIEYHIPFFLPLHIMMIDNWELPQTCKTINLKLDKKCLSSQYAIYNHYNSKTRKGSLFFILFYTVWYIVKYPPVNPLRESPCHLTYILTRN